MTIGDLQERRERWPELNPRHGPKAGAKPWRNTITFVNTPFIAGTTSIQVLQGNIARDYLLIQNKSAGNMWVVFNQSATQFAGVLIEAGGYYEPYSAPWSSINILGAAANLNGVCIEGVRA
jgi:hypothetical protein